MTSGFVHASTFTLAFFLLGEIQEALSEIRDKRCWLCLCCFDCPERIWLYRKAVIKELFLEPHQ